MDQAKRRVACSECGEYLDEPFDTLPDSRPPCPSCGSKSRRFEIEINDSVKFYGKLGIKARRGEVGKPYREVVSGDDLHRKTGKWMHLERSIDREKDQYRECVTNPETGDG